MVNPYRSVDEHAHCDTGSPPPPPISNISTLLPPTATRYIQHFRHRAAQGSKALGCLHTHEGLDGFSENVRLVHIGVGHFQGLFIECIVDCDGGTHIEAPA